MSGSRRAHRKSAQTAVLAMLFASAAAVATPAAAKPHQRPARGVSGTCPAAFPVSALRSGMAAYGLTTDHGQAPNRFSARVLGVLHNGIAPGIDMIVVRASSPAIRAAGGIWSGMSGSPVYASDGRLIGAVAYALTFGPSPTAGLTPAKAMYDVLSFTDSGRSPLAGHVTLTPALQRAVVADGLATPAAAAAGLVPLSTPVAVSGVDPRRLAWLARTGGDGVRLFRAGSAPSTRAATRAIRPGSPFAVAVSYGAFTYAGIGTATAVCGNRVVAWGHPMMAFGSTSESAHVARILYIQKETLGPPFLVGNVGGVVGQVTQDRLSAVAARMGTAAPTTHIRVSASASNGLCRIATTQAPVTSWLPTAAANAAYGATWSTMQMDGVGSAFISWSVSGHRAHGRTWTYSRTDRTDSKYGIGYSVGDLIFFPLDTIVNNPFEKVTVDRVRIRVIASQQFNEYQLRGLKVLSAGQYVDVTPSLVLQVEPGQAIALRARLTPYQHVNQNQWVELSLRVPEDAPPGAAGQVSVVGGADSAAPAGAADAAGTSTAASFDDVLSQLRTAPRNDRLYAELDLPDALGNPTAIDHDLAGLDRVVRGAIGLQIRIAGGNQPPPAG